MLDRIRGKALWEWRRWLERRHRRLLPLTVTPELRSLIADLRPWMTQLPLLRIGSDSDGGYLVPDDLDGIHELFSPGVAETASFEADLADRGITPFLADYSVAAPPASASQFDFTKRFIGTRDDDMYMRLVDWVASKSRSEGDLILQMDIEGAEWPVLLDLDEAMLQRFRILVIEFHDLDLLFVPPVFALYRAVFDRLLRHFVIVHIHPNNAGPVERVDDLEIPTIMEFTLIRRDRVTERHPVSGMPNPLDAPCLPSLRDVALPTVWWRR